MSSVNLPLSGPVTQSINPWTFYMPMVAGSVGSYTVNVGTSSDPSVELAALDVASYGKQLGRIEDALVVLLRHFRPEKPLSTEEQHAIDALKSMIGELVSRKARHHSHGLRL
jgi:hypothetical protein